MEEKECKEFSSGKVSRKLVCCLHPSSSFGSSSTWPLLMFNPSEWQNSLIYPLVSVPFLTLVCCSSVKICVYD